MLFAGNTPKSVPGHASPHRLTFTSPAAPAPAPAPTPPHPTRVQEVEIDFTPPFRRISMLSGLEEALGVAFPADLDSEEARLFLVELVRGGGGGGKGERGGGKRGGAG